MGRYSSKPSGDKRNAARGRGAAPRAPAPGDQQVLREWLKRTRFKRALIGGVRESDVWKKIGELNALYEQSLAAERVRYDALLDERARVLAQQMQARPAPDGPMWESTGDGSDE